MSDKVLFKKNYKYTMLIHIKTNTMIGNGD